MLDVRSYQDEIPNNRLPKILGEKQIEWLGKNSFVVTPPSKSYFPDLRLNPADNPKNPATQASTMGCEAFRRESFSGFSLLAVESISAS